LASDRAEESIDRYLNSLRTALADVNRGAIATLARRVLSAQLRYGRVYIFGNGGSASTASHFVNDLIKCFARKNNNGIAAQCLSDNISVITATANDMGFDNIFEIQLIDVLTARDLVIAISTSGNSENVVRALRYAKSVGAETIALTGSDGGQLIGIADYAITVPTSDQLKVEDSHLIINHLVVTVLREDFDNGYFDC
jgi:D-sedoheptulose 7-phosphate isomerase